MAHVYFDRREIAAKVVYFGAPGAGSNTNVRRLYGLIAAREKSALHSFGPTEAQEQSCFFEYVPPGGGTIPGMSLRVRVYSLPGGVLHAAHRREVFEDLDGVVFVADARASRADGNAAAARELEAALAELRIDPHNLPVVLQTNHGDALDARALGALADWAETAPTLRAVARSSVGVVETHDALVDRLSAALRGAWLGNNDAIRLVAAARTTPESAEEIVSSHIRSIRASASSPSLPSPAEFEQALEAKYRSLPAQRRHEIPFNPRDALGARPVRLLDAALDGERVVIDLVLERVSGSGPERVLLSLQPRPGEHARTPAGARATPVRGPAPLTSPEVAPPPAPAADHGAVWFGVIGTLAGLIAGAILGFLTWA